jgi:hypothetical protein
LSPLVAMTFIGIIRPTISRAISHAALNIPLPPYGLLPYPGMV